ncbi:MAG: DUF4258 domain-containing protein [bacterium]|nr:DUF4258 domain-containing protein [bacterium]
MVSKPPENPLEFIQYCVKHRAIRWTYHVNMRLMERSISRKFILDAVNSYVIIESYPKDKYLPSYLVYAESGSEIFHILFATDVEGNNVRVLTAYYPDPEEWQTDLKTRRHS